MKFQSCKGSRVFYNFLDVEVEGHTYYYPQKQWLSEPPEDYDFGSSGMPCKTFRAFKRFLRKNPQFKGKCWLTSRFVGHDIWG